MDQVQLRPSRVGITYDNNRRNTHSILAGGGYLPGVMYRATARAAVQAGWAVCVSEQSSVRINPWEVLNSYEPIDLKLQVSGTGAGNIVVLGVAVDSCPAGKEVLIAGPGSIVAVRCIDVDTDTLLATLGCHVIAQDTLIGVVGSGAPAIDVGRGVGRVVVPPGADQSANQTGSNEYAGIIVQPF